MTLREHKKHTDLPKPSGGKIHRNEIAVIGAPCHIIQHLSRELARQFPEWNVGYLDAVHNSEVPASPFHTCYTDRIDFHQVNFATEHIDYDFRKIFQGCDLVLVNGNHFKAEKQLVIVNRQKKESLEHKLDRLSHVSGFILDEGETALHDYLKSFQDKKPVVPISDLAAISKLIMNEFSKPVVKGLVLAGGKSLRMGEDKGDINYHGLPQREHTARLLDQYCDHTYISAVESVNTSFKVIPDSFTNLGPVGGILSAFRHDPNAAWLVVATDIPLLDRGSIEQLVKHRNISKVATCFHNPETGFPEPLITIWEPRAYPRLLDFLSMGYACPRKALINSDIEELEISDPDQLLNANTPEEKSALITKING